MDGERRRPSRPTVRGSVAVSPRSRRSRRLPLGERFLSAAERTQRAVEPAADPPSTSVTGVQGTGQAVSAGSGRSAACSAREVNTRTGLSVRALAQVTRATVGAVRTVGYPARDEGLLGYRQPADIIGGVAIGTPRPRRTAGGPATGPVPVRRSRMRPPRAAFRRVPASCRALPAPGAVGGTGRPYATGEEPAPPPEGNRIVACRKTSVSPRPMNSVMAGIRATALP